LKPYILLLYTKNNTTTPVNNFLEAKNFLLDLLFPKFCLGCQKEGAYLCEDCRGILDINQFNYCLCENSPQTLPPHSTLGKCPKCSSKNLSGLYFALPYKEKQLTKKLIYQFKYQPYLKDLSKVLASLIIEHLILSGKNTNEVWQNSVLIPVPLRRKKFNERGYNQSEELAKELSKILKIPVIANYLIKTKETNSQMTLKKDERETNLLGAFKIASPSACNNGPLAPSRRVATTKQSFNLQNKKVFLVDDVYTTGSTMQECAKVLKAHGAKSVWGICITRDS